MSAELQTDEQVFFEALDIPVEERDGFLDKLCAGDVDRKKRIETLLESHRLNSEEEFLLDKPPVALQLDSESSQELFSDVGEKAGDQIGRYRLLEHIGEGGMGSVYMAEQTVGVRRRVALKIIKLGMDTRQVIARFEAERQAMALFDHPNIAKVLDIGATESGRPYFVMELVKGKSLTEFVAMNELDLDSMLSLFVEVCNAVQHAHQKGIIHRDLKPSNVLVTLYDGKPVPKVIDFGIAKAIGQQRLTDKTLFTRYSAMVGTPQYMSPEQAELTGMDVDTRSDIYSLGVLLYELVTGSTPLQISDVSSLNPLALYETLRDTEVEMPSMRLERTKKEIESNAPVASERKFRFSPSLIKRDIDWIILKALSRDRSQRYGTASELASDVKRYLDDDSVLAAPPSKTRWLRAFYRKNRVPMIATAIVSSTLLIASVACLIFGISAMRANSKLNLVNQQLSENVERLIMAENKLQREAEAQKYSRAISVAAMKFEQRLMESVSASLDEEESQNVCCTGMESTEYLDLDRSDELGDGLAKIRDHFYESEEFQKTLIMDQFNVGDVDWVVDHDSTCLKYRPLFVQMVATERHRLFRFLVREYRKSFGEQSPQVAEALILLAACLEEIGEVDEAESHAREAIAIGNAADQEIARTLLEHIKRKRSQLKHAVS